MPGLETKGLAVYLSHDASGLMIGFVFDKPPHELEAALRRLVASRAKPMPETIPPKARRAKEEVRVVVAPEPPPVEVTPVPVPVPAGAPEVPAAVQDPPGSGRERRTHLRLCLGPGFQARFHAGGDLVPLADLTDLSIGGCCLRLAPEGCRDIQAGALLEGFHFLHRDLPNGTLQARVSWILGKNAGERAGSLEDRYCLVGVEFCAPPPEIVEGLEAYIAWHIEMP